MHFASYMGHPEPVLHAAEAYHPRTPQESPLWNLLDRYFDQFTQLYNVRFAKDYGFFRPVVSEVVHDYLKCGDLAHGFARVRCPDCRHEFLLAFSCRGRWFCPSCHTKKVIQFGELLRENIIYPVPHRQYVFSIPIILRKYFLYDRKLLSGLCRSAHESLLVFFRTTLGKPEGVIGTVMAIQTFGDYAKWHPHIHSLTADGLFDERGVFYCMPKTADIQPLAELFRANVLKILKRKGLIDDQLIAKLLKWQHTSGFSVHNGVRLARDDSKGLTAVAQYILRNPFAQGKITFNETTGMVVYKSKMSHSKAEGGKKNFVVYPACNFIAAITQHIPEKRCQMVRYYGWYSNKMRGERRKLEEELTAANVAETKGDEAIEIVDVSIYKPRRIPTPTWRECIKKIWEIDPLKCPHCKAEMKIISFISEPKLVRKILEHLKLWTTPPVSERLPPTRAAPLPDPDPSPTDEITYEPFDDGWPQYEEPFMTVN